MTRLTSYQNAANRRIASAQLSSTVFESMLRCAELLGYESVSDYVKDAILDKMDATASTLKIIVKDNRSMAIV